LNNKNPSSGINGYIAGYITKACLNSPWSNNDTARCRPHPGHSMPKNFLFKQGSIKSSRENNNKKGSIFMKIDSLVKITINFGE
jgi:hypothetical protein